MDWENILVKTVYSRGVAVLSCKRVLGRSKGRGERCCEMPRTLMRSSHNHHVNY